jgi:peptide/nickel transport system permease protein
VLGYIIRRVLQAILITIGVTLIVFILLHVIPGGSVARNILGPRANAAQIAAFNHANGLDQSLPVQYLTYLWQLMHGDFGFSYKLNQSVGSLLLQYLPKTLLLLGLSYIVAIVIAIPLGIYQAVRRNKVDDYILTGTSFVLYSMPVFWLGIILIALFSFQLHWFSPEGPQGAFVTDDLNQLGSLVLPVATLSLVEIASFSRYMRSATLENLVQDYTRTARAKGASNSRVLFVHVLRNAMIPILTLIGLSVGYVFSGALITEALFNYPGIGYIFWNATLTTDYPIILGVIVVTGFATILGSLMADVMYAIADPRVRYRRA